MAQQLSTNTFGCAKWIVSSDATQGTHTTIASALTSASSGDTIFIRPGTYTENLTLKAGVDLCAFVADGSLNGTGQVIISGNATMSTAGSVTISGIQLQTNSAAYLTVSGSAASIVNLTNCYLNATNATGISFSSSSASAQIWVSFCYGDVGTTGIAVFSSSSAGLLTIEYSTFSNSGATTTASTASAGTLRLKRAEIASPITTSSTNQVNIHFTTIGTSGQNATCLTVGGSGTNTLVNSHLQSGTASAISVGSNLTCSVTSIGSTNTNAITGAGTVNYGGIILLGSGIGVNTTTQTELVARPGICLSTHQPAFAAEATSQSNVTGDGTNYTVTYTTVVYDQASNFDGTSTFTAPYTGKYQFNVVSATSGLTAAMTQINTQIVTTARGYSIQGGNIGAMRDSSNVVRIEGTVIADMTAGDTTTVTCAISNGTKVANMAATSSKFQGFLVC